jgi:sortase A
MAGAGTNKKKIIGLTVLLLAGLSILLYPFVSNWWNVYHIGKKMTEYSRTVSNMSGDSREKCFAAARKYNKTLILDSVPAAFAKRSGVRDPAYEKLLNLNKDGIMGEIDIPSIDVELPIYHYTSENVLKKGAGHLPGSSLPIGGKNTHAVIFAHRGLPSAKLFTDLNLLKKGDHFYIKVLGKTLEYKVDHIVTVKPRNTKYLAIRKDKDYVTLVTCTPYGINTERLLVRGTRVPYDGHEDNYHKWFNIYDLMILVSVAIGLLLAAAVIKLSKRKKDDSR